MNRRLALLCAASGPMLTVAGCSASPNEPAWLRISLEASAKYPADLLRILVGPQGELAIHGSSFKWVDGSLESDSLQLSAATSWPLEVTLVSTSGDTLGSAIAAIALEAAHLTTVWLAVRANRVGLFVCAPTLAKAPVDIPGAVPDTMDISSWGPAAAGEQFPVC